MFKFLWGTLSGIILCLCTKAQTENQDTTITLTKNLPKITIIGRDNKSDIQQIPDVVGTSIYAGKKNSLVVVKNVQGNVVNNTMRQVLAKVPGIHVWESDPSGIQIGIASRGLSPNRSWEFNVRQNGYDIAADPFGYPEAYYNPPMQSVQRIEMIRGQGSLQYGPQFGGMVNYIIKDGSEINKTIGFEMENTVGSNAMFNSFNAIGGRKGKFNYYSFFNHRTGNGWRDNSQFLSRSGFVTVTYAIREKLNATFEYMHSHISSQQPGGLTDSLFMQNPRQSRRGRNWLDILWKTPAFTLDYNFSETGRWSTKIFATMGDRNSVGFMSSIVSMDTINHITNNFENRTLNADAYRNIGLESRLIKNYILGRQKNTNSAGIRLYRGSTERFAKGKGTSGSKYDMTLIGDYPQHISFNSKNFAAFTEQLIRISNKIMIIPGFRYEWIQGAASGQNGIATGGDPIMLSKIVKSRSFLLGGIGIEFHITPALEWYANITQAYRPIQFANLQAPPSTDQIDPNLVDQKGYNFDLGHRGKIKKWAQFDLSVYFLDYRNRIGVVSPTGSLYRFITNVGNSTSKGLEAFFECNAMKLMNSTTSSKVNIFLSYSYNHSKYGNNCADAAIRGKQVENAPKNILRTGCSAGLKSLLLTTQLNVVDKSYSDANNTIQATDNAQSGLIPSYKIVDCSFRYTASNIVEINAGVNNVLNTSYFTRRSSGYPGPGALPGDGRTYFLTVSARW